VKIAGEKKSFDTARITRMLPAQSADPARNANTLLRLKVNFSATPLLCGRSIFRRGHCRCEARGQLFRCGSKNEAVFTNAVPVQTTAGLTPPQRAPRAG
jgi:hypothetical protein